MKFPILNRKVHYWASLFVALPFAVILTTGLLLQFKKQVSWVQPTEQRGRGNEPVLGMAQILEICRSIPKAEVLGWEDVNRIDVRPSKGMLKVSMKNGWEVQIDSASGEVLQVAFRRSDLIEAIHDGSWFHEGVKYGVFVPAAVVLLLLWATGLYLFVLPFISRRKRQNSFSRHKAGSAGRISG
jgi:uncharacterized iron-regulated membrane protein